MENEDALNTLQVNQMTVSMEKINEPSKTSSGNLHHPTLQCKSIYMEQNTANQIHILNAHLQQASVSMSHQCCMTLATQPSTMESLENEVATHFGATPLWLMRLCLQASSQH